MENKMIKNKKKNMYGDSKKQWNVAIGCLYSCSYCIKSFRAQMKRQMPKFKDGVQYRGCQQCYDYVPHFHENRLMESLPKTNGDEFIWCCSSGDISFFKPEWMLKIIKRIKQMPDRTFFFQTKNPIIFNDYYFPKNCLLGITLETNRDNIYDLISNAPLPSKRFKDFLDIDFDKKVITIEPILKFDLEILVSWLKELNPERIYLGFDTKKTNLPEPTLQETMNLYNELKKFTKVKLKHMKIADNQLKINELFGGA